MAQYELNIHDYWRIIRKRKWILIFTTTAVLGSVMVFTNLQTPIYQATATVKVEPALSISGVDQTGGWDVLTALNTEVKIIKSALVSERTARKLGLVNDQTPENEKQAIVGGIQAKVSADKVGDSNLITISATSSDAKETEKLANATAQVYIEKGMEDRSRRARELREFVEVQMKEAEIKLRTAENNLKDYTEKTGAKGAGSYMTSRLIGLETRKSELSEKYTPQHPEVKELTQQIEEVKEQMKSLPTNELESGRLTREVTINEELYTLLAKRFKESQITEADRVQSAFIVTPALEPSSPVSPNRRLNISVGAFIGIFLGFIFAILIENLDTSIGTIEDVEKFLDLPVLGIIPHIELETNIKSLFPKDKSRQERAGYLRGKLIAYHSSKSPFV
jgi:uncharacterized protein involved in exopolysaccharide biosynthesis